MNTIKIMQARITGAEKVLGPNHAKLSESINFLANEYKEIGDYPSAEKNFNRALTIRKVANGSESPEVAQTECDLGEMYLAKGDKTEAEVGGEIKGVDEVGQGGAFITQADHLCF